MSNTLFRSNHEMSARRLRSFCMYHFIAGMERNQVFPENNSSEKMAETAAIGSQSATAPKARQHAARWPAHMWSHMWPHMWQPHVAGHRVATSPRKWSFACTAEDPRKICGRPPRKSSFSWGHQRGLNFIRHVYIYMGIIFMSNYVYSYIFALNPFLLEAYRDVNTSCSLSSCGSLFDHVFAGGLRCCCGRSRG
jgi:hypothetical protein